MQDSDSPTSRNSWFLPGSLILILPTLIFFMGDLRGLALLGEPPRFWLLGYLLSLAGVIGSLLWEKGIFPFSHQSFGLLVAAFWGFMGGFWSQSWGGFLPSIAMLPLIVGGSWTRRWRLLAGGVAFLGLLSGSLFNRGGFFLPQNMLLLVNIPVLVWVGISRFTQKGRFTRTIAKMQTQIDKLSEENRRDSLTGLWSRAEMEKILESEHLRHLRYKRGYSLALMDIDGFKSINEGFGTLAGDQLIKDTAELIIGRIRRVDGLCRWSADQFIFVFPETLGPHAQRVLDNLRSQFHQTLGRKFAGLEISVSVGVADTSQSGGWRDILQQAQLSLYLAKETGGNRTTLAEGHKS